MVIKQINIINFSGTRDRVIDLSDGFNVIEGENESGKSTLSAFIKFMLYGFADKNERQRFYTWGGSSAAGTMTVQTASGSYRIEREYIEGSGDRTQIIDLANAAPCRADISPSEMFLCVPAEVFSHTAFIGQTDQSGVGGEKLSRAIENILFSADENVNTEKALKKLDDARILLYHKSRKGGRIYDLLGERDSLRLRLEKAKQANIELIAREGTLRETKAKIEENTAKLAELASQLEYCDAARQYRSIARYKELSQRTEAVSRQYDSLCGSADEDGFAADGEYVSRLNRLGDRVNAIGGEISKWRSELSAHNARIADLGSISAFVANVEARGGEEEVAQQAERLRRGCRNSAVLTVVSLLLMLVCSGASALLFLTELFSGYMSSLPFGRDTLALGTAGVALLFFIIGVLALISRSRRKIEENEMLIDLDVDTRAELNRKLSQLNFDETRIQIHRAQSLEYENKINELENELVTKRAEISELASKLGCTSAEEAIAAATNSIEQKSELKSDLDKYTLARDTLGGELGEYDEGALLAVLNGRPYDESCFDETETARMRTEYDFFRRSLDSLGEKSLALEKDLAVLNATVEAPTSIADRITGISKEIEELSKKHRAYLLAHATLTEAASGLRDSVAPRLSETASSLMSELTSRKYTSIGVGSGLELEFTSADSRTHSVGYMSSGTQDLAYVSLRFALIGILYRNETPPLIFDESFARLDDTRLSNMVMLISKMTESGSQTLLFTSQKRDAVIARSNLLEFNHIVL